MRNGTLELIWRPRPTVRLGRGATPFGPLDLNPENRNDSTSATLEVKARADCMDAAKAFVAHLSDGGSKKLSPQRGGTNTFPAGNE